MTQSEALLTPAEEGKSQVKWTVRGTIAYWAGLNTIIGSWLFILGSVGCYPHMAPTEEIALIWIDYPFLTGAITFFIANYLIYFNMLNKHHQYDESTPKVKEEHLRFIACPEKNIAHIGCLLNMTGAICFQISCTVPLFISTKSDFDYNFWFVIPGSLGSIAFTLASICEGEHNGWRKFSKETLQSLPVWQSWFYFLGSFLFFVGYAAKINHMSYTSEKDWVTTWVVATPWTVGSVCFLFGAHIDLFMWKQKNYGLGWAKNLHHDDLKGAYVDPKQQAMIIVYTLLVVSDMVDLGMDVAAPGVHKSNIRSVSHHLRSIAMYFVILLLASVIHTTPNTQPYTTLLWMMRVLALWDFASHIWYWYIIVDEYALPEYKGV